MGFEDGSRTFQQDNGPKHKSRVVQNYLEEEGVNALPWSAYSPDLNPIENLWAMLKWECRNRTSKTMQELFEDL